MLFNSYIFIFVFLPTVLIGYFFLNKISIKFSNLFLVLMSLWFYGFFNYKYLVIIILSVLANYVISSIIINYRTTLYSKAFLIIGIIINLLIIFYFKYSNFFIENINRIFQLNIATKDILLPLGISFFTFQQISFIVDSYKEETKSYNFIEYAMFVTFFPQLIAGPIVLHNELIPLFRDTKLRKFNIDNFVTGVYIFVLGLCKKVLIADNLNVLVVWLFNHVGDATCMDVIIGMIAYTFQIYFDFSGYCDMALGIAKMFNFYLPVNFNSPYKCLSIIDFWKRWHISLTRFLTRYVYIPLGGNRKGTANTYKNILITFVLSGLWHGANWTFVLWGTLHGVAQILTKALNNYYQRVSIIIKWIFTFIFINFTWLLFRANSIFEWMRLCGRVVCFKGGLSIHDDMVIGFKPAKYLSSLFQYIINKNSVRFDKIFVFIVFAILLMLCLFFENNYKRQYKFTVINALMISALFVLCIIFLSKVSVFLYFNF